jgi:misacylated tRNA(Ala) deacylase
MWLGHEKHPVPGCGSPDEGPEKTEGDMMQALYLNDCYLKEWDATIESVKDGKYVVLDKTAFYPNSGGQPNDTGVIIKDGVDYPVVFAVKKEELISHEVSRPGLSAGDKVSCAIDWEKRYTHMKMHTAAHVLSRVIFQEAGAHTSGNQLGTEESRIDFTLENLDKGKIQGWFDKANDMIAKGARVEIREISREQADKELDGPSKHLMADLPVLRLVKIEGVDMQTCGGTHLKDISEIGKIIFSNFKNKGANNRRIYYRLA